ncbi:hypothetical protein NI389_05215 [Pseudoalteromonas xiamenensis]|uniref:DUF6841 family protein n=1 Tax=Pseudoalteromonas xiamenensis TaxID=882626 RepID=UPI0027E3D144|nr:hypothetical protein [Pseudoalteromonas xiamenensis]WMN60704.1 hypothetical protein NI389_04660 [Pseudoalteromonas xiamenensis]WMN60810.1 hypothetical protein NI389_05215 [Pseudoalteromonas xiamenensis]
MSDSRPPKFYSDEQLHSQIQQFLTALKARGVTHVNWQKVDIHLLGEHMALASNIAIRRDKNADIVDVVGASYTLYKQEQGWRIVAFAIHSADTAFIPQT